MMQRFLALLNHLDLGLDAEAIADALWLAYHIGPGAAVERTSPEESGRSAAKVRHFGPDIGDVAAIPITGQSGSVQRYTVSGSSGSSLAECVGIRAIAAAINAKSPFADRTNPR
jgi:hypothetical protein